MATTTIVRFDGRTRHDVEDELAREEPLEIRVADRPIAVTMRTPGDDFDLAVGFLLSESVVASADEVDSIRHWGSPNVVRVALRNRARPNLERLKRNFYSTSACGVCGKASIEGVRVQTAAIESPLRVSRGAIAAMPAALRAQQKTFDTTGGLHAAGLFSSDGTLVSLREDIGRHNAVDKVIGAAARNGSPLDAHVLFVSGRAGFEVLQKAAVARIPVVAAVGAPSSLAVDLARELNLTLAGFVRDGRFNVYAAAARIE